MMQAGIYKQDPLHLPRSQQGAVLAVSLIILLVLTILGITAMRSVTMEEKMASNAMNRNAAFSASESATIGATSTTSNLEAALATPNTVNVTVNSSVVSTAVITFRQVTLAPNNSITLGKGRKAYHFDIASTGRVDEANARSGTREGIFQVAPGGP